MARRFWIPGRSPVQGWRTGLISGLLSKLCSELAWTPAAEAEEPVRLGESVSPQASKIAVKSRIGRNDGVRTFFVLLQLSVYHE